MKDEWNSKNIEVKDMYKKVRLIDVVMDVETDKRLSRLWNTSYPVGAKDKEMEARDAHEQLLHLFHHIHFDIFLIIH